MSISNLSYAPQLNVLVNKVTVSQDAVNPTDLVTLRQMNLAVAHIVTILGIDTPVGVVSKDPMTTNDDISTLSNSGTVRLYNTQNSNFFIKLPSPTGINGFQVSIVNISAGTGVLRLCTDNFNTSIKNIAPEDNGLKCLAYNGRYIFMML